MIERQEFRDAVQDIRGDIKGITDRLDILNGRTRANEQNIAVLNDRDARGPLAVSGGIAAVVAGVFEALHWWFSK